MLHTAYAETVQIPNMVIGVLVAVPFERYLNKVIYNTKPNSKIIKYV